VHEAGLDDGQAARCQQGPADALQRSGGDQQRQRRCEAAQQRRQREQMAADDEDAPPPEAVAQRAAQQDERSQRERVAVDDPLQAADAAARSPAIAGSATLTTVESSEAMPEPSTVPSRTQRPVALA